MALRRMALFAVLLILAIKTKKVPCLSCCFCNHYFVAVVNGVKLIDYGI